MAERKSGLPDDPGLRSDLLNIVGSLVTLNGALLQILGTVTDPTLKEELLTRTNEVEVRMDKVLNRWLGKS